ncbi:hypothetical protein [Nocardia arizonensis]|uniref:hypothetical protein n=1 Tax=Nocardia arizonensis TaxID=1141647 RepID=UPI0012E1F18E|nr:hypothetical protein [Nocardia arizonensis]
MSGGWRQEPPVQHSYTVAHVDRGGRGAGHHALSSMAGPEFTGIGAVYAPLGALPVVPRLVVLAVLVLVGMGGCTVAWIDQQHYVPSPDICRPDQLPDARRLGCVAPQHALRTGVVR